MQQKAQGGGDSQQPSASTSCAPCPSSALSPPALSLSPGGGSLVLVTGSGTGRAGALLMGRSQHCGSITRGSDEKGAGENRQNGSKWWEKGKCEGEEVVLCRAGRCCAVVCSATLRCAAQCRAVRSNPASVSPWAAARCCITSVLLRHLGEVFSLFLTLSKRSQPLPCHPCLSRAV